MMKSLPLINHPNQFCEGCLLGKQFRKSFPHESNLRAQKSLELIHTDVCGPIKPISLAKVTIYFFLYMIFKKNLYVFFKVEVKSF